MLVILSDLHLTDGSTAVDVDPSAIRLLSREIAASAAQRRATETHVVLLGDIFDLVRTDYWHRNNVAPEARPWGGTLDPLTAMNQDVASIERQFAQILQDVLASPSGTALVAMLRQLPTDRNLLTYVVGNHDRVLNNFAGLKQQIATAVGPEVSFDVRNAALLPEYGVLARHGHEWDDNCHGWTFAKKVLKRTALGRFDPETYRVMAIGEAITAELMGGLVYYVRQQLDPGNGADSLFLRSLQDVNNLRPMTDALRWIGWLTRGRDARYRDIAQQALKTALDSLLGSALARRWDHLQRDLIVSGDITDHLARARKALDDRDGLSQLSDLVSILSKLKSAFQSVFGGGNDGYLAGAEEEFSGALPGEIQYIVYGHTHNARHDYIHADLAGRVHLYINSGTYLPLIERTLDGKSFAREHRMTTAFFYHNDEDREDRQGDGPTVDLWDGARRKVFA